MSFQSGDSAEMPLVEAGQTLEINDRWKVVDKMEMITQYTFAGDFTGKTRLLVTSLSTYIAFTVEAIDKAVSEVAKFDGGKFYPPVLKHAY